MSKVSVYITVSCLLVGSAFAASIDCNIDECRKPMKIYEELGCKPIYGSKSCCPKRYECPDDLKFVKDESKCTFKGREYAIGDILPRNLTNESKCLEACTCSRYEDESVRFLCTNSDCGISSFKVPGCINIYGDLNECCSTSIVCDDEEKENLATCWDGDVEYHEGEKFRSKSNPCYECLCHKDFDNTTIIEENSHCHKLNCEIELKYKSFIQRGCLPIFENDKCCPVDWKCFDSHKKGKKIAKRSADEDSDEYSDEEDGEKNAAEKDENDDKLIDSSLETDDEITTEAPKIELTTQKEKELTTTPVETSDDDETTTKPADDEISTESSTQSTESTTKSTEETTSSSILDENSTNSATEASTTETTTETTESVTTKSTTESSDNEDSSIEKNDSSEEKENSSEESSEEEKKSNENNRSDDESDEDAKTNIFGEDTAKTEDTENDKSELEAPASSTTEAVTESTTEEQATISSAEDESSKSLDEPEKITTATVELTTESSTENSAETTSQTEDSTANPTTSEPLLITLVEDLKKFVSKLSDPEATKATVTDLPATFVNFTLSRVIQAPFVEEHTESVQESDEKDQEISNKEIRKRSERSADLKNYYLKYSNKDKGCSFGTQFYKIGDEIKTDDRCLDCFCDYSPIGHCVRKDECVRK